MTSQAELDFMQNFQHQTDGAKWAKNTIESLRQQLAAALARLQLVEKQLDLLGGDE
jgi:hypothetical protein